MAIFPDNKPKIESFLKVLNRFNFLPNNKPILKKLGVKSSN